MVTPELTLAAALRRLPPVLPGPPLDSGEQSDGSVHGGPSKHGPNTVRHPLPKGPPNRSLGLGSGRPAALTDQMPHPDLLAAPGSPCTSGHSSGANAHHGSALRTAAATGIGTLRPSHSLGHNGAAGSMPDSPLRGAASDAAVSPPATGSLAGSVCAAAPQLGPSRMGPARTSRASDPGGGGGGGGGSASGASVNGGLSRNASAQRGQHTGASRLQHRVSGQGYCGSAAGGSPTPGYVVHQLSHLFPSYGLGAHGSGAHGSGGGGGSVTGSVASGSLRVLTGGPPPALHAGAGPSVASSSTAVPVQAEVLLVGTSSLGGADARSAGSAGGRGRGLWACFCLRPRSAMDHADAARVHDGIASESAKEGKLRRRLFPRRLSQALIDTTMVRSGRLAGLAPAGNSSGGSRSARKLQHTLSQQPQKSILKPAISRQATPPRDALHINVASASPAGAAAAAAAGRSPPATPLASAVHKKAGAKGRGGGSFEAAADTRDLFTHTASGFSDRTSKPSQNSATVHKPSNPSQHHGGGGGYHDEVSLYGPGMAAATVGGGGDCAGVPGGGARSDSGKYPADSRSLGQAVAPSAFAGFSPEGPDSQARSGALSASQQPYVHSPRAQTTLGLHRLYTRGTEPCSGNMSSGRLAGSPAHGSRGGIASQQGPPGALSHAASVGHTSSRRAGSVTHLLEASASVGDADDGRMALSTSGAPPAGGSGGGEAGRLSLMYRLTRPKSQRNSSISGGGHALPAPGTPPLARGPSRNAIRPLPPSGNADGAGATHAGPDPHQQPTSRTFRATLTSTRSLGTAAAASNAAAVTDYLAVSSRPGSPRALLAQRRSYGPEHRPLAPVSGEHGAMWASRRGSGAEANPDAHADADGPGGAWTHAALGSVNHNPLYTERYTAPPGQLVPIAALAASGAAAAASAAAVGNNPERLLAGRQTTGGLGYVSAVAGSRAVSVRVAQVYSAHNSGGQDAGWRNRTGSFRRMRRGPSGELPDDDALLAPRLSAAQPALPALVEYLPASSHGGDANGAASGADATLELGSGVLSRQRGRALQHGEEVEEGRPGEAWLAPGAREGLGVNVAVDDARPQEGVDLVTTNCVLQTAPELVGAGPSPAAGMQVLATGSARSSSANPCLAAAISLGGPASGSVAGLHPRSGETWFQGTEGRGLRMPGRAEGAGLGAAADSYTESWAGSGAGVEPGAADLGRYCGRLLASARSGIRDGLSTAGSGARSGARSGADSSSYPFAGAPGRLARAQQAHLRHSFDSSCRRRTADSVGSSRLDEDGRSRANSSTLTGERACASSLEGCAPSSDADGHGSGRGGGGGGDGGDCSASAARGALRRLHRGNSVGSRSDGSSGGPSPHLDSVKTWRPWVEELARDRPHSSDLGVATNTLHAEAAEAAGRGSSPLGRPQRQSCGEASVADDAGVLARRGAGLASLAPLPPIPQAAGSATPRATWSGVSPLKQRRASPRAASKLGPVSGDSIVPHAPSRLAHGAGVASGTANATGGSGAPTEALSDSSSQPRAPLQQTPSRHRLAVSVTADSHPASPTPGPVALCDTAATAPPPLPPASSYPMPKSLSMEAAVTGRGHASGPVPAAVRRPSPAVGLPLTAAMLRASAEALCAAADGGGAAADLSAAAGGDCGPQPPGVTHVHHDSLERWVRDHSRHVAASDLPLAPIDPLDDLSASAARMEQSDSTGKGTPAEVMSTAVAVAAAEAAARAAAAPTAPTAPSPASGDEPLPAAMPFRRSNTSRGAPLAPEREVLQQWLHHNFGARSSHDGETAERSMTGDVRSGPGQ